MFPCPYAVYMYTNHDIVKHFLFRNQLANFHQVSCQSYCWNGICEFVQMVSLLIVKPVYGKIMIIIKKLKKKN